MNLRELLETAHLDALGMLDEQEQRDFEAAFNAAAPGIRAQIRSEQARWARTAASFSEAEPPAGLRDKVMERVAAAIEEEHAPIAGSIGADHDSTSDRQHATARHGSALLHLGIADRVSPLWRAGSVGFATAAMVCLGVLLYQLDQTRRLSEEYVSDRVIGSMVEGLGPRYYEDVLFKPSTQRIVFTRTERAAAAEASLFINPDWTSARLFCRQLPVERDRVFRLVVLNQDNEIVGRPLLEFATEGGLTSIGVLAESLTKGSRIAIAACSIGKQTRFEDVILIGTIPTA